MPSAVTSLILASASPRRLQLLQQAGVAVAEIIPADIDETPHPHELPEPYARRMAKEKAEIIARSRPQSVVLAADTVVACGRRILPKAEDEKTARRCLELLSGRRHRVYTAVCIIHQNTFRQCVVMTQVKCARLGKADIAHYIASKEWEGKAGGYAIQGLASRWISAINGSYSNVVGLPLFETCKLLDAIDASDAGHGQQARSGENDLRSADRRAVSATSCEGQQARSGENDLRSADRRAVSAASCEGQQARSGGNT